MFKHGHLWNMAMGTEDLLIFKVRYEGEREKGMNLCRLCRKSSNRLSWSSRAVRPVIFGALETF